MRKPNGQFKCMVCGRVQPGSQLEWSDRRSRWMCEDVFCVGNVFPVDDRKRHYLNIHTIFQDVPTAVLAVMDDFDGIVSLYKQDDMGIVRQTAVLGDDGVWVLGAVWERVEGELTMRQVREDGDHYYLSRMDEDELGPCICCAREAEFVAGRRTHGHRHWCAKCYRADTEWVWKYRN